MQMYFFLIKGGKTFWKNKFFYFIHLFWDEHFLKMDNMRVLEKSSNVFSTAALTGWLGRLCDISYAIR